LRLILSDAAAEVDAPGVAWRYHPQAAPMEAGAPRAAERIGARDVGRAATP
jgi:hypothetical protein